MSIRKRDSTQALAAREMAAKRGFTSSRSKRKRTGATGWNASERSSSTTATRRSTSVRSMEV